MPENKSSILRVPPPITLSGAKKSQPRLGKPALGLKERRDSACRRGYHDKEKIEYCELKQGLGNILETTPAIAVENVWNPAGEDHRRKAAKTKSSLRCQSTVFDPTSSCSSARLEGKLQH